MKLNKTKEFEKVTVDIGAKARAAGLPNIWHAFSDEKRAGWVRPLMTVGHSNTTAAKVLGLTPGQVAGIRDREHIPSRNPATRGRKRKTSNVVKLATVRQRKEAPGRPAPPKYKMTTVETEMCSHEEGGKRCPFVKDLDSDFCELHRRDKRKR